jgi:sulfite exporter TauE/SafE/plastocyanin
MDGVTEAEVSYSHGTAKVLFDDQKIKLAEIEKAIEELDYKVIRPNDKGRANGDRSSFIGVLLIIAALYMFLSQGGGGILTSVFNFFPQAERGMGYGMLFVVGLLTSAHCIAMCGGINLSQSLSGSETGGQRAGRLLSYSNLRPTVLYNAGRVISYTLVGGIVGALGAVISFSGVARGVVQIIAGIFMVMLGMNMLGMFNYLRALTPRLPKFITRRLERGKSGKGPLVVGLLNGLMPCGPLQAMQIYALSTGSPLRGALAMLAFSLGTVPLMFGLGAFGSLMSKKFAGRVMRLGAALVIIMGVVMFSNGTALSGMSFSGISSRLYSGGGVGASPSANAPVAVISSYGSDAVQEITTSLTKYGRYSPITVKAGVPVKWTIHADPGTVNGCNNAILIPSFNIQQKLKVGDTVVEFTPTKPGTYRYSCWMGMIRSTITVVDGDMPVSAAAAPGAAEAAELEGYDQLAGAACSCCAGGF